MQIRKTLVIFSLILMPLLGAQIPRKSPEFAVQLPNGKQALTSSYRGKVLCLVIILTT